MSKETNTTYSAGKEIVSLTHDQKSQAISLKYYQGYQWEPKKGDYYTSSRADLELYRIVDEDEENFYTIYCDPSRGSDKSKWLKSEFLKGFGVNRIHVPDSFLLTQEQLQNLMHPECGTAVHSMPLPLREPFAASLPSQGAEKEGEVDIAFYQMELERQQLVNRGQLAGMGKLVDKQRAEISRLTTELAQLKEQTAKLVDRYKKWSWGENVHPAAYEVYVEINKDLPELLSKFQGAEGQQNDKKENV